MRRKLLALIFCLSLTLSPAIASGVAHAADPAPATTPAPSLNCQKGFFFLPSIYEFTDIQENTNGFPGCSVQSPFPFVIVLIGLGVVDILLRLVGFVAVVGIIIGGVRYMTAGGSFEKTAGAKQNLYNALVGLAIASVAAGLVAFLGNSLTN